MSPQPKSDWWTQHGLVRGDEPAPAPPTQPTPTPSAPADQTSGQPNWWEQHGLTKEEPPLIVPAEGQKTTGAESESPLAPLGKFLTHFKDSALALATALNPEQLQEDAQGNVQYPPGWHPEAQSFSDRLMALADDLPIVHQINQLRKGQVAEALGDLAPTIFNPEARAATKGAVRGAVKESFQRTDLPKIRIGGGPPISVEIPVPRVVAHGATGAGIGYEVGKHLGVPGAGATVGAVTGAAVPVVRGAIRGARSAFEKSPPPETLPPGLTTFTKHQPGKTPTFSGNAPGYNRPLVPPQAAPEAAAPSTPQVSLDDIAMGQTGKKFAKLSPDDQASIRALSERINKASAPSPQAPAQSAPFLPALDRVEMNRMLHAKAQNLNLPNSPPGVKAPGGFFGGLAREHFQTPYESLSLDQMKQLYDLLDTKAIPQKRRGGMLRLAEGGSVNDKRHPEVERLMRDRMPMIGIHLILGVAKPVGKR